jgi:hypothetical protein
VYRSNIREQPVEINSKLILFIGLIGIPQKVSAYSTI